MEELFLKDEFIHPHKKNEKQKQNKRKWKIAQTEIEVNK